MIDPKFSKPYDPTVTEDAIYARWEESGFFNPDNLPGERSEPFTITLPPPNVTGVLHLGHAYEDSLQDAVIRYQRMLGKRALWVPGTDSAAIATQARVEKNIQKDEGKSRHDLGRDELVTRVAAFAKASESTILSQVRKMGASLDWSRYAYTMDSERYHAVMTAFVRMYEAGLVYRGHRIVNWDPKGQTTISDDEIVYEERDSLLYTFTYSADFPIPIATTRLETKVGDVAVAVHPDDERYAQFVGTEYDVVFCDVPIHIKIVADHAVEKDFGTGAIGVTPAHSHVDWDIAERHNLPRPQVINEYAKMSVDGRLKDKKTTEARELVAEWLRAEGLMQKEEKIKQNVSTAERTGGIVEPLPKLQWFVDVDKEFTLPHSTIPGIQSGSTTTLKAIMLQAVESGAVQFPQEGYRAVYFNWITNLRDWCISRQIWFGHRIPVWYKPHTDGAGTQTTHDIYCGADAPEGEGWIQDPDVLDTWFSASLWPFSTLGWPHASTDLATYYPTAFMSPAYEIINLWVSRMIMMSGFHLGVIPFKKVLIHGLVRDTQGRKFSKSLNNGIDPLDIIAKYGADALRMGLLVGAAVGSDIRFEESKVKGYKNFANKIWNIARFVLEKVEDTDLNETHDLSSQDQEDIEELNRVVFDVTRHMDEYRIDLAADRVYHYVWHTFADDVLERSKFVLNGTDAVAQRACAWKLYTCLTTSLKLLHPFMPFVTEEIWHSLPQKDTDLLMVARWPVARTVQ